MYAAEIAKLEVGAVVGYMGQYTNNARDARKATVVRTTATRVVVQYQKHNGTDTETAFMKSTGNEVGQNKYGRYQANLTAWANVERDNVEHVKQVAFQEKLSQVIGLVKGYHGYNCNEMKPSDKEILVALVSSL